MGYGAREIAKKTFIVILIWTTITFVYSNLILSELIIHKLTHVEMASVYDGFIKQAIVIEQRGRMWWLTVNGIAKLLRWSIFCPLYIGLFLPDLTFVKSNVFLINTVAHLALIIAKPLQYLVIWGFLLLLLLPLLHIESNCPSHHGLQYISPTRCTATGDQDLFLMLFELIMNHMSHSVYQVRRKN